MVFLSYFEYLHIQCINRYTCISLCTAHLYSNICTYEFKMGNIPYCCGRISKHMYQLLLHPNGKFVCQLLKPPWIMTVLETVTIHTLKLRPGVTYTGTLRGHAQTRDFTSLQKYLQITWKIRSCLTYFKKNSSPLPPPPPAPNPRLNDPGHSV